MHEIRYLTFTSRKAPKTIAKECDKIATEDGDYHHGLHPPIRFKDRVMKNYDEAWEWIKENDKGWYDSLAVKFKDKSAVKWLVKIEYHV